MADVQRLVGVGVAELDAPRLTPEQRAAEPERPGFERSADRRDVLVGEAHGEAASARADLADARVPVQDLERPPAGVALRPGCAGEADGDVRAGPLAACDLDRPLGWALAGLGGGGVEQPVDQ
jgi:hypothetical protein